MHEMPGGNCGDDPKEHREGLCSTCGQAKVWVSHGPSAAVFECPDCN